MTTAAAPSDDPPGLLDQPRAGGPSPSLAWSPSWASASSTPDPPVIARQLNAGPTMLGSCWRGHFSWLRARHARHRLRCPAGAPGGRCVRPAFEGDRRGPPGFINTVLTAPGHGRVSQSSARSRRRRTPSSASRAAPSRPYLAGRLAEDVAPEGAVPAPAPSWCSPRPVCCSPDGRALAPSAAAPPAPAPAPARAGAARRPSPPRRPPRDRRRRPGSRRRAPACDAS